MSSPISSDNQLRSEEEDRASLVSRLGYDITLTLSGDQSAATFTSRTVMEFDCAREGAATFINLHAPILRRVVVNGREVTAEQRFDGNRIAVAGLRRGANRVEVVAECAYGGDGVGLHRFHDPVDGAVYLYTNLEPFDAHRVFACFDQPSLKAPLAMHVDAPAGWTVRANAPVSGSRTGDGRSVWDFATTPPLPPYLFAVVAGDFDVVDGPPHGSVPLALLCRRSLTSHVRDGAAEVFDITRRGLAYFEQRYGHAYPFGAYNQVFVPEANMGAMENPGCVTFNEMFVFRGPVSALQTARRANVILHEMVHVMGFGDVVTMRDWGDLWLNETFATVEATIAVEALGIAPAWVDFAGSVKSRALHQDQLSTTHPILVDATDTDSIRANFDGITYHKGASVLRQLIAWVGDEPYASGIRSYFKEFLWGNATRADFLAHQAARSGRDLDDWSRLWLETAGVNTLRPETRAVDGRQEVTVHQLVDAAAGVLRPHHLGVGLYDLDGGSLVARSATTVEVIGAQATVEIPGAAAADLVIANDGDLTFAKLRFDERSLATLLGGGVSALGDALPRSLCWTALHDMARDGELRATAFVGAVVEQAAREADPSLLERLLSLAVGTAEHHTSDGHHAAALAALAGLAATQLETARSPLIWARCLVGAARQEAHLDLLQQLVDGEACVEGLVVDHELRWAVLARLATEGRAGPGAVDAALELDPTETGHRSALSCLAARPEADAKAQAWAAACEDASVSRVRVTASLSGFSTGLFAVGGFQAGGRDQAALTAPYIERYLQVVPSLWSERQYEVARAITEGLFPHHAADAATIAAVELLIDAPGLAGNARRVLMEGRDGLRRALRARLADGSQA